jgi:hypothetical protein
MDSPDGGGIQACSVTEHALPVNFLASDPETGVRLPSTPMRFPGLAVAFLLFAACATGLQGSTFTKGELKYRVALPDATQWKAVSFADNDLAWVDHKTGQILAINSTCENYGDPSLEVLTQHLMMGFTDKTMNERKTFMMDNRDALQSSYSAKLDGVPIEVTVTVMKKDGCVHDFTLISPPGQGGQRAELDHALDGFTTTSGAPPPREATVRLGVPEVRPDDSSAAPEAKAQ